MKLYHPAYDNIQNTNPFHLTFNSVDSEFRLDKDKWIFTSKISDADIIPIKFEKYLEITEADSELLKTISKNQILLVWFIETWDSIPPHLIRQRTQETYLYEHYEKTLFVHTNKLDNYETKYVAHDLYFNRQKLFCTDYQENICKHKLWTFRAPGITYTSESINKIFSPDNKIFLAPNRIRNQDYLHDQVKRRLRDVLNSLNIPMYHSEPINGTYFLPNGWDNSDTYLLDIMKHGGWFPIADSYFNTSYITVCAEINTVDNTIFSPCEKYFDSLLKGNFPLILGAQHYVEYMKNFYGFKFPDWIDYSYDSIYNFEDRVNAYFECVRKAANIPLTTLHELYVRDKHILDHNRNLFFHREYDSLYDKVKNTVERLNW